MMRTSSLRIHKSFLGWLKKHMEELVAVVFDIDGVLFLDKRPVAGSRRVLNWLRQEGVQFSLLTNDSNQSVNEKSLTLQGIGLNVFPEEIISSGEGLVELVRDYHLRGNTFFVMGDLGNPCFGESAGLVITRNLEELPACIGVIVGEDNYDWESVINSVVNYFVGNPTGMLIVPNPDEYFPKTPKIIHVAAGGVARFIQGVLRTYGISLAPTYLGKPYEPIFKYNHARLEQKLGKTIDHSRVLMIGDFLEADIQGANNFGYRSALLLSASTTLRKIETSQVKPELLFERL